MALRTGNDLYFKSGIDNSGLKRGTKEGKGILRGFASQVDKMDVFAGLSASAVLAFSKAAKSAKKFSIEMETSLKEVQTISTAVQENYQGFEDQLVRLSTTVPDNATALTKAYYQIVSAGYDGAAGMELLETAAQAAVGGVTDTMTAADGLTTVLNAWKLEASEVGQVSDLMFQTVKQGKTTFDQISASISQVAPLAAAYKVGFEEISAITATLTKQGTPTSVAMTQIRAALISVTETLGQGWRETYTFQEALEEMRRRADASGKDLKEFTGRVEGALGILAVTGDNAQMAAADIEAMANSVGASSDAFKVMSDSAEVTFAKLSNTIEKKLKPLGDFMRDTLVSGAERFTEALDDGTIDKYAKGLAIAATAMVAYKTATAASTITHMQFLRTIVRVRQAIRAMNVAAMANPIGLLAAGIAAATTAFIAFREKSVKASKETKEFMTNVSELTTEIDGIFGVAKNAEKGTDAHKEAISRINGKYGDYLDNLLDEKSSLEDIKTAQNQAKDAAISRIAETARAQALQEEQTKLMNAQGKMQLELYDIVENEAGSEAAMMAVKNFGELSETFYELYKNYTDVSNAATGYGKIDAGKEEWNQLTGAVSEYVDTYADGSSKAYNNTFKFLKSMFADKQAYDAAKKEIDIFYKDFINDVEPEVEPDPDSDDPKKGKSTGGDGPDISGELIADLDKAKEAFEEWEQIKETSRAEELAGQYSDYTDMADNYEEYLKLNLQAYQGNAEARIAIIERLAGIEVKQIEESKKEAQELSDQMDAIIEEALGDAGKMMSEAMGGGSDVGKEVQESMMNSMRHVAQTAARFMLPSEVLDNQLDALEKHYKKAMLPIDQEYWDLRDKLIQEYTASEISYWTQAAEQALSGISSIVGDTNDELAGALSSLGGVVGGAGQAIAGFASGDIASGISGTISALGDLRDLIDVMEDWRPGDHKRKLALQELNREIDKSNRLLSRQLELLTDLRGIDWTQGANDAIDELEDLTQQYLDKIQEVKFKVQQEEKLFLLIPVTTKFRIDAPEGSENWDVEQWQDYLDNTPELTDKTRESIQEIIDMINDANDQAQDLEEEISVNLTGTTADSLTDTLVNAFADGKNAAADFTQTFEDLMKGAIMESFKRKYIVDQMEGFYETFSDLTSNNQGGYGNLTQAEINQLQSKWDEIIVQAQAGYDAMTSGLDLGFGMEGEDPNSLSGAIKGITEDTAGVLAGQMGAIRINVARQVDIATQGLDHLAQIENNTAELHEIKMLLRNDTVISERLMGR